MKRKKSICFLLTVLSFEILNKALCPGGTHLLFLTLMVVIYTRITSNWNFLVKARMTLIRGKLRFYVRVCIQRKTLQPMVKKSQVKLAQQVPWIHNLKDKSKLFETWLILT
uniref:(northern house mosquito) hypothetical protein n=1 Tax=Culex pipiens TaxID=7175 RepID=A0A8D8NRR2_CULPI